MRLAHGSRHHQTEKQKDSCWHLCFPAKREHWDQLLTNSTGPIHFGAEGDLRGIDHKQPTLIAIEQVEAKLGSKSTSKWLKFSTLFRIVFWNLSGSIVYRFGSHFGLQLRSKKGVQLKKAYVYEMLLFTIRNHCFCNPKGSKNRWEIDAKTTSR